MSDEADFISFNSGVKLAAYIHIYLCHVLLSRETLSKHICGQFTSSTTSRSHGCVCVVFFFPCAWPWTCLGALDWLLCPWKGRRSYSFLTQWNPMMASLENSFLPVLLSSYQNLLPQGAAALRELPSLSWPLEGQLYLFPCWLPARPVMSFLFHAGPSGAEPSPPPSKRCTDPPPLEA